MLHRSLTAKILVAVGVTVAVVIAIYTYFVIRVQSAWWRERTQAQNVLTAAMIQEHLEGAMLKGEREEVQRLLERLKKSEDLSRARVIRSDGAVVFSSETQEVHRAAMQTPPELFTGNQVLHGLRKDNGETYVVVMRPVLKHAACAKCHANDPEVLGAVVLEKSMGSAEANIATNRNLLIVYGVVIFVLVGVVLWLLTLRLVSQPVSGLLAQMRRVERGDLTAHADAQRPDEIGELARDFNAMVRSLRAAKRELHNSHEKQIQQASKLASIGELASSIAHEIRNPLAGIRAAVEVLAEDRSGADDEVVHEIRRQITRLNTTLRDLLGFARSSEPEVAPCEVRELVRPMLALVRPDAQKYHVTVVEELPADLPPISADASQIQQALLNVLLNAIQAMPDGGRLTVSAVAADGKVGIRICDTGIGIARANVQKIFSPFFTTKHRGTGLGLAITRSIIEKHRGRIAVESEPGCGTTFSLEFATCESTGAHEKEIAHVKD